MDWGQLIAMRECMPISNEEDRRTAQSVVDRLERDCSMVEQLYRDIQAGFLNLYAYQARGKKAKGRRSDASEEQSH